MKCEAYSTLSDFDGDAELEAHLQARIASASGPAAPRPQAIAPAALYLTAILEYVSTLATQTDPLTASSAGTYASALKFPAPLSCHCSPLTIHTGMFCPTSLAW